MVCIHSVLMCVICACVCCGMVFISALEQMLVRTQVRWYGVCYACVCGVCLWYLCACTCDMEEAEEAAGWAGRALGLGSASRTAGRTEPVPAVVRKAQFLPAARPEPGL